MSKATAEEIQVACARLDWAMRHVAAFERSVDEFLQYQPFAVVPRVVWHRGNERTINWVFRSTAEPPMAMRFLAGDAVHGLRATVDNLLWSVGQRFGASKGLSLRFADTAEEFAKHSKNVRLARLPKAVADWYEAQLIYNLPLPRNKLLRLNRVWNGDKHRVPVLVGSAVLGMGLHGGGMVPQVFMNGGPEQPGETVAAGVWTVREGRIAQPAFEVDIGFGEGISNARRFLRDVHAHIRDEVIPLFRQALQASPSKASSAR